MSLYHNSYAGSDTITSLLVAATAHHSTPGSYKSPIPPFQELSVRKEHIIFKALTAI